MWLSSHTLKCWMLALLPIPSPCVCPVQANLVVQENRYVLAMQDLQKAQAELDDKQAELDVVQAEYEQAMTEKQVTVLWHGRGCHTPHGYHKPFASFSTFYLQEFGF